jgi:hypothetical protein
MPSGLIYSNTIFSAYLYQLDYATATHVPTVISAITYSGNYRPQMM